jgi:hypothetical protein
LENEKKIFFGDKIEECSNQYNENNYKYYDTSYFAKISSKFSELINNYQIRNNKNTLSNIINSNIYFKAKILSNQLTLIHNTNNNNINNNYEAQKESLRSNKSENSKINKRKSSVLLPGKNYLEDNGNKNICSHMEYSNLKKSGNSENYLMYFRQNNIMNPKELKISPEEYAFINPNKGGKEMNIINKKIIYINIESNRKLSSNETNKEKNNFIKKYLLAPYFLRPKEDREDEEYYINGKRTEDTIKN